MINFHLSTFLFKLHKNNVKCYIDSLKVLDYNSYDLIIVFTLCIMNNTNLVNRFNITMSENCGICKSKQSNIFFLRLSLNFFNFVWL